MFINGNHLNLASSRPEKQAFYIFIVDIINSQKLLKQLGEEEFFNFYLEILAEILNGLKNISRKYQVKFFIKNLGDGLIALIQSPKNQDLTNDLLNLCQYLNNNYPLRGLISHDTLTCLDFSYQRDFKECVGVILNKMFALLKTVTTCDVLIDI